MYVVIHAYRKIELKIIEYSINIVMACLTKLDIRLMSRFLSAECVITKSAKRRQFFTEKNKFPYPTVVK